MFCRAMLAIFLLGALFIWGSAIVMIGGSDKDGGWDGYALGFVLGGVAGALFFGFAAFITDLACAIGNRAQAFMEQWRGY